MGEKMSNKKNTSYEIEQLSKRFEQLEKTIREFMDNWGPEVQQRRDLRDEKWDEMIRVLSIQRRDENG